MLNARGSYDSEGRVLGEGLGKPLTKQQCSAVTLWDSGVSTRTNVVGLVGRKAHAQGGGAQ